MTVLQKSKSTITASRLVALHALFLENQDKENAAKVFELHKKIEEQRYIIGFTGHFSAGKSSMINALLSEDILPRSPIPTSGNIVEITSYTNYAQVIFQDNTVKTFNKPYDTEMIQAFCKDKQTVKKVQLSTDTDILPPGCSLMDTPGIDAADDADRLMTESALHLMDALFYVMDYNHVQSEVNLTFLKKLQSRGIPFYIIVNQIDKHDNREMSFEDFEVSVKQTFDQWYLSPESVYFSSLIDTSSQNNNFQTIKTDLFKMLETSFHSSITIDYTVEYIVEAHKQFMEDIYNEKNDTIIQNRDEVIDPKEVTELNKYIQKLQSKPLDTKKTFQFELNHTLKNAYLMPADLRDKAKLFLESRQKDFKVGLFGSKHKTQVERDKRLNDFIADLQENIRTTIQWKLRDKIINLLTTYEFSNPKLVEYTKKFAIDFNSDDAITLIKSGATLNGEYVLRYTDDIVSEIKGRFKREAQRLWEFIDDHITKSINIPLIENKQRLNDLEQALTHQNIHKDLENDLKQVYETIDDVVLNPNPSKQDWQFMNITERLMKRTNKTTEAIPTQMPTIKPDKDKTLINSKEEKSRISVVDTQTYIDQTLDTIKSLPGFQTIIHDLQNKKSKLSDRKLTIALFGAFSAGKSSFANALMGEYLLPSSPNPTTAVINEIAPVTRNNEHGTVVIQLKTEATLKEDVISLVKDFSPPNLGFSDLIKWLETENIAHSNHLNKTYQLYLQALISGYVQQYNRLGEILTIDINDFNATVTNETIACYMESVTLYYDCELTRQGITLVDTPGADSVNARHTNVAFDYIKYADAILYVTYFNHAISRADRDFLTQLGRVKESFALDKMFFIINASDLASSEADLKLVENYVEEQLQMLGIRQPSIFPISSKVTLENKLKQQSLNDEMNMFETKLNSFIDNDLPALSIEAAIWDITRAYESMQQYIQTVSLNDREKREYEKELQTKRQLLLEMVHKTDVKIHVERIDQRIRRQLHYIGERLSIQFHDFFTESFNPTTIIGSGKQARECIKKAFKQLLDRTGYELLQEIRAVSLRVEKTIKDIRDEVFVDFQNRGQDIDENVMLPIYEMEDIVTPLYKQAFLEIETDSFKGALGTFKGTKSFFERNEKEKMKELLFEQLKPYTLEYIKAQENIMLRFYINEWHTLFDSAQAHALEDIESYISNTYAMINDTPDLNDLNKKLSELQAVQNQLNKR